MGAARSFKQRDVTRAIKAAQAAGMRPHVWIGRNGAIHIAEAENDDLTPPPVEAPSEADDASLWDKAFD